MAHSSMEYLSKQDGKTVPWPFLLVIRTNNAFATLLQSLSAQWKSDHPSISHSCHHLLLIKQSQIEMVVMIGEKVCAIPGSWPHNPILHPKMRVCLAKIKEITHFLHNYLHQQSWGNLNNSPTKMLPQNPIETIDYYQLNSFSWLKPKFILSVTFELLVFRKIKEQRYIPMGRTDGLIGRKNRWVNRGNKGKNRWVNRLNWRKNRCHCNTLLQFQQRKEDETERKAKEERNN